MTRLTPAMIESMLLRQDAEFRYDFSLTNTLLHSAITEAPEPELLAAGIRQIQSEDPRRRILGTRLLRELKDHGEEARTALTEMLSAEHDPEVMYWIVGAFGFIKSNEVTDQIRTLADHPDPGVRYNVATALANRADEIPAESVDTLITLTEDENEQVRFSAVFELGSWWQVNHDPRIESALRRTISADADPHVISAAQDALGDPEMTG